MTLYIGKFKKSTEDTNKKMGTNRSTKTRVQQKPEGEPDGWKTLWKI